MDATDRKQQEQLISVLGECAAILETLSSQIHARRFRELSDSLQDKIVDLLPRFRTELFSLVDRVRSGECDAPPYAIVQACNAIGIGNAEDVRWMHADLPQKCCQYETPTRLPDYKFTYSDGSEVRYGVYQCQRCKTVRWRRSNEA